MMAVSERGTLSRIVVLLLIVLGVATSLAALAFVRFSRDLDRDMARTLLAAGRESGPQVLRRPIGRALSLYASSSSPRVVPAIDVPGDLAADLVPGTGPLSSLKRHIYSRLLVYRHPADTVTGLYLSRAYMGTVDGSPLYGFYRASNRHFGVPAGDLSFGEAILLCDLAAAPRDHPLLTDFSAALDRRDRILARMRGAGLISDSEWASESSRPLAPGSDHRPIW